MRGEWRQRPAGANGGMGTGPFRPFNSWSLSQRCLVLRLAAEYHASALSEAGTAVQARLIQILTRGS